MGLYRLIAAAVSATLVLLAAGVTTPVAVTAAAPLTGTWSAPFEEDPNNAAYPFAAGPTEHCDQDPAKGYARCKPAAVNAGVLPDGRVLYWNGLSDLENVQKGVAVEGGGVADSSQARILDLRSGAPVFSSPTPTAGHQYPDGAGPEPCDQPGACGASQYPLPGNNGPDPSLSGNSHGADHDMFCSDEVHLADGRILVSGGTRWYPEPGIPGTPYGQVELQGLRLAQVFDPRTNTFSRVAPMNNGRWYPSLVMEGNGNVFVGGGVRKLIQTDGTNVRQTETFDPNVTSIDPSTAGTAKPQAIAGKWTVNPGGDAALPLFPRFHLLPNGSIYYGGAGQMWGPAGESGDEALYGLHQSYNPAAEKWTPFGFGQYGARSGAFSVLMPLHSPYTSADVLVGGGTLGPPPGGYVATNFTELAHFSAASNWSPALTDFTAGPALTQRRWFSSAVTLPNDAVAVFSGANKDEVVDPGNESAVRTAEWYTPWDNQFHALSDGSRDRTYHNTAILLPDASVLVGGHAPIAAHYGSTSNTEHDATAGTPAATANNFRDPSFEIYRPPYLAADNRPVISRVQAGLAWGQGFDIATRDAHAVSSVKLITLPALTHTVDNNMRSVDLPFTARDGRLDVHPLPGGNVIPPGSYYLFINRGSGAATVPSTAAIVQVGNEPNLRAAPIPFGKGPGAQAADAGRGDQDIHAGSAAAPSRPAGPAAPAGSAVAPAVVDYRGIAASGRARADASATRALLTVVAGCAGGALAALELRRRRRRAG